jgi:hypothetical protein
MNRRTLLKSAAKGVAAVAAAGPLLLLTNHARADNQMSKDQAKYRDQPNGDQQCNACANFLAPSGCSVVSGQVSPSGWCQFFQAKTS